jgi:hypothetical protein
MTITFDLEDFSKISSTSKSHIFPPEFHSFIDSIDKKIIPIFPEKIQSDNYNNNTNAGRRPSIENHHHNHKRREQNDTLWSAVKPKYTVVEKQTDGVEKWIQEIRVCINKMSLKNYENQKTAILELLEKCIADPYSSPDKKDEKFKKIADFVFSVASSNIFFASIYASLFKVLMGKYTIFSDLLKEYLNTYVSGVNKLKYADPDTDYDAYCLYNKENDMRKANAVFIINLVKQNALPVMRVLNIITSFQDLTLQYIEEDDRVHEVEEIAEILFLFLKGGKEVFQECKAEFIWKFVIIPNIEKVAKFRKGDKVSLSNRAIFKYMDIVAGINAKSG